MPSNAMVEIPQDVLDSARLTRRDLKIEIAVHLYSQHRLSIGKAKELANMHLWEFRQLLALRKISPHYDQIDFEEDLDYLRQKGLL